MSIRSSGWLSAWALMTVSELTAGMNVTFRPCAANKPWCRATKKPAESTAGTTATFSCGSSMTGGAASPPPASFGTNRIAKTATATMAPTTSAPRTARVNLRAIDGSSLSRGSAKTSRVQTSPQDRLRARADPDRAGYCALLPGKVRADTKAPGAGCEKNIAASCSERHRSADRSFSVTPVQPGAYRGPTQQDDRAGDTLRPGRGKERATRCSERGFLRVVVQGGLGGRAGPVVHHLDGLMQAEVRAVEVVEGRGQPVGQEGVQGVA